MAHPPDEGEPGRFTPRCHAADRATSDSGGGGWWYRAVVARCQAVVKPAGPRRYRVVSAIRHPYSQPVQPSAFRMPIGDDEPAAPS